MKIVFSLVLVCIAGMFAMNLSNAEAKPNIIFIVADDLGWGDVGYNGSTWVETPNIDALARSGQVFDNAYSYPTCSPARAAILTGKQSFKTQVYGVPVLEKGNSQTSIFSRGTVQLEHTLYSEPLKKAGYTLAHLGKWHIVGPDPSVEVNYPFEDNLRQPNNGDLSWLHDHKNKHSIYYPQARGFDLNVGGSWWGDPARGYTAGYKSTSGGYIAPFNNPFIEEKRNDKWLTDRLTDEAIEFMGNNTDSPFFINLHFYAPHRPSIPRSESLLTKYKNKKKELLTGRDSKAKAELAAYGTLVESLDQNVGRLIDYLDASGLRENTLIIFTSDNGFNSIQSIDKRLKGAKGSIYEGGVKVPMIANWPSKISAARHANLVSVLDYFPSFLELAGVHDYSGDLDGNSFVPLMFGQPYQEQPIFWHINSAYKHEPVSAVRVGQFKLIQFLLSGKVEIYDLVNDPSERVDISKTHLKIKQQLLTKLVNWRAKNAVPLPPASPLERN